MGSKGLKIPVSVVRFRPWAPTSRLNQAAFPEARITSVLRLCFGCASPYLQAARVRRPSASCGAHAGARRGADPPGGNIGSRGVGALRYRARRMAPHPFNAGDVNATLATEYTRHTYQSTIASTGQRS